MTEKISSPKRQKRARQVLIALGVVIVLLLIWRWWWSHGHVYSDNAQLEGHIIPISARVGGYVQTVAVADNQPVENQQLLVGLDPRDYAAKVALAEADYQQALSAAGKDGHPGVALAQIGAAQANAAAAGSLIRTMEAQITEGRANVDKANRDYQRNRELADKKMVSPAALDAAETALKTAQAHVQALEAQLKSTRESAAAAGQQVNVSSAGLKSAQAKVMATEAALQLARNQLIDCRVLAPSAGIVSKKAVEPGQMIQPGQTLFYLVPTDQLWVTANLKETELKAIKPGQEVDIEVDTYPGRTLKGKVDSFSGATGARFTLLPPDNATGNFTKVVQRVPVKITLDELPKEIQLRPGLSVSVTIHTR